jgi:hypothetical protein
MPRGGARPGAGRKPKREPASPASQMPLDYLLSVMRDPEADPKRRDAAAKAAARYLHKTGGRDAGKGGDGALEDQGKPDSWSVILGGKAS